MLLQLGARLKPGIPVGAVVRSEGGENTPASVSRVFIKA
jgi:hypothetical protein